MGSNNTEENIIASPTTTPTLPPYKKLYDKKHNDNNANNSIICMEFMHEKNLLLSCSENSYIMTWDLKSKNNPHEIKLSNNNVPTCCVTKDENIMWIGTEEGFVFQYDLRSCQNSMQSWNVCDDRSELNTISLLDKETLVMGDDDGNIHEIKDYCNRVIGTHENVCTSVVTSDESIFWSSGLDCNIRSWQRNENKKEYTLLQKFEMGEVGDGFVYSLAMNEYNNFLASALGSGEIALLHRLDSSHGNQFKIQGRLQGHTAAATCVEFTAWDKESQMISCGNDQNIILWDILLAQEEPLRDVRAELNIRNEIESQFFDWNYMKMKWHHDSKLNSCLSLDLDSSSAMIVVCDVTPNITLYLIEG